MHGRKPRLQELKASLSGGDPLSPGKKDPMIHLGAAIIGQAIKDVRGYSTFVALDAFTWLLSPEIEEWVAALGFSIQPADMLLTLKCRKGTGNMLNVAIRDALEDMDPHMKNRFKMALVRYFPVFIQAVADQVRSGNASEIDSPFLATESDGDDMGSQKLLIK